jgi:quinoprotein glucose dehydrogenase
VTAGGLVFIGATNYDKTFRAVDAATGRVLWSTLLPASGNATPAVYEAGGRQFVVIAAGGGKWGAPSGGTYVAFALPAATP